ncbi:transporter [Thioalkalivibrio denitrificans]|uniref:Transporter n=1 Tax=Thioalkalivibrio denitrificans TaxID=108003 RepID=A0A1V3NE96_9GAMM|nr:TolC family protein [Thioalkalivibrio denitrificans]OOG23208.1 transporter [Thioalkalivibrio denitrificans]
MIPSGGNARRAWGRLFLALALGLAGPASAESRLPQPLSLSDALALADDTHPAVNRGRAGILRSEAERLSADSANDLHIGLRLHPRWIEPNDEVEDQSRNDSRAILRLSKPLYDFGRTSLALEAADTAVRSQEERYLSLMGRQRMEIMRRFFEVLLADLTYTRDNEAMAIAFVSLDRARNRNELGQVSDIDLLALEDHFQETRLRRMAALQDTRAARDRLALALNRLGQGPADLRHPELPGNDRELPDLDTLYAMAEAGNRQLASLRLEAEAASQRMAASRAERRPTLSAEVEAAHYERVLGGRDPLAAGIVLDIPLYSGRRVDASVARQQAELYDVQTRIRQHELDLRQAVLETWQEIQRLRTRREQSQVRSDYRELYLDRSRALYEMEVQTDLGDAMTQWSAAMLFAARTEFELALAWERLALLTGQPNFSPVHAGMSADMP